MCELVFKTVMDEVWHDFCSVFGVTTGNIVPWILKKGVVCLDLNLSLSPFYLATSPFPKALISHLSEGKIVVESRSHLLTSFGVPLLVYPSIAFVVLGMI